MYKVVIGLEVHAELNTKSKNFSRGINDNSLLPNEGVTVVDLGMPGILPVANKEALKKSVMIAKALHCDIPEIIIFDRKNYFYPDLPKGYQITQATKPVGTNGYVMINVDGVDKKVLIHDTHLEEDTANLDHKDGYTLINYNRAGVPLLETVTEPCLNSAKEAISFLEALRNIYLYCDVSDCRSDLGEIRTDVNVSLMKDTDTVLGTKVEMKNINSFYNVKLAIEYEIKRQEEILSSGGKIIQETRRFDDNTLETYSMRTKVDAVDYKYYVEPNIPPIKILKSDIDCIMIPVLPFERVNKYMTELGLSRYDADIIVKDKNISDYYEETVRLGVDPKVSANWLNGSIISYLSKNNMGINDLYLTPVLLKELIDNINEGKISNKQAKEIMIKIIEEHKGATSIIAESGIKQLDDDTEIRNMVIEILDNNLDLILEHKKGRNVFDFFVGQIMKKTKGQANPKLTALIIREEIEKR